MFSLSRVAVKDRPPVEQSAGHPFKVESLISSGSSGCQNERTFEVTLSKRMNFQTDFLPFGGKFRASSGLRGL